MDDLFAGVELGGTKCILLLARGPGEIIAREQLPTLGADETLASIERILSTWRSEHELSALGIGGFGPLDLDPGSASFGEVKNTPKPGWSGAKVLSRLESAAGVEAHIDTDVNGAALAEIRWGSGRGFDDFAYVTVGTGVGVGLIANGQPTRGFAHCELGHIRPPRLAGDDWPGTCPFHGDCVEGLASGPAIKARFGTKLPELRPGDPAWAPVRAALAQLCHVIVCAAAPQAIAMGGGVIEGHPHLRAEIESLLIESLAGYIEIPAVPGFIRAPELGSDAGPLGAIALAMRVHRQRRSAPMHRRRP